MRNHLALIIMLPSICVLTGGIYFRFTHWPAYETVLPLSINGEVIRVQLWTHLMDDADEVLVIETSNGSLRADVGSDWGVGPRLLFYRVAADKIGILRDGATFEAIINLGGKSGPFFENTKGLTGDSWTYLGSFARSFSSPDKMKECYAMLGAGDSAFRKNHQDPLSCSQRPKSD